MEILLIVIFIVIFIFYIIYKIDLKITLWAARLVGSKKRWVGGLIIWIFIGIPLLILFSG